MKCAETNSHPQGRTVMLSMPDMKWMTLLIQSRHVSSKSLMKIDQMCIKCTQSVNRLYIHIVVWFGFHRGRCPVRLVTWIMQPHGGQSAEVLSLVLQRYKCYLLLFTPNTPLSPPSYSEECICSSWHVQNIYVYRHGPTDPRSFF